MANDYYDNRGQSPRPGISRTGSRPASGTRTSSGTRASTGTRTGSGTRTSAGARTASGARPGASRPAQRTGSRPSQGYNRPTGGNRRPPQRRRRKAQGRFYAIVAAAVVLVVALVLIIAKPFGGRRDNPVQPVSANVNAAQTDTGAPVEGVGGLDASLDDGASGEGQSQHANIADMLADEDNSAGSLAEEDMATVSDLRINTALPSDWLNVMLLGTDERWLNTSARTDTMMICSINRTTGEVKLASIMRDLAIDFTDLGKYNGTWRMNAANYFGGPNLTMRTVNEKFGMNIQYYVLVNFFGFQRIAERLGGIDIDISEEEMNEINKWAWNSYKIAYFTETDISDVVYEKLETFGENTHLNGTQTLAYARIRKLAGGDYQRSERQRKVLSKLLEKAKKLNAMEIAQMAALLQDQVKTNMPWDDIINTAIAVAANGLNGMETMQLPVTGTYQQTTRNNQSMLYDCDFTANATQLYNFIYE